MRFLDRLFRRTPADGSTSARTQDEIQAVCPHITLIGHWGSVDDVGKDDKATGFTCGTCQTDFSPEEGYQLLKMTARVATSRGAALVEERNRQRQRRWPGRQNRTVKPHSLTGARRSDA